MAIAPDLDTQAQMQNYYTDTAIAPHLDTQAHTLADSALCSTVHFPVHIPVVERKWAGTEIAGEYAYLVD
jgi:hypothetical protein